MWRGVRRIEALGERTFVCEAALLGGDVGDRLGNRVHGMSRAAQAIPVCEDRLRQAGLADDAPFGLPPAVGDIGDQPPRATHIGLFVICDEQAYGAIKGTRHQCGDGGEAGRRRNL